MPGELRCRQPPYTRKIYLYICLYILYILYITFFFNCSNFPPFVPPHPFLFVKAQTRQQYLHSVAREEVADSVRYGQLKKNQVRISHWAPHERWTDALLGLRKWPLPVSWFYWLTSLFAGYIYIWIYLALLRWILPRLKNEGGMKRKDELEKKTVCESPGNSRRP